VSVQIRLVQVLGITGARESIVSSIFACG
jgi:hypothetical protein